MNKVNRIILDFIKHNIRKVFVTILVFLLGTILALIPAKITQIIIDAGFVNKNLKIIIVLSISLLIIYGLKVLSEFLTSKIFIELSTSLMKKLKDEIYDRILSLDMSFFSKNEVGYINSRIAEISQIDIIFSSQTLTLISSAVQFIFAVIILITINWKFLLIMLIPVPMFFLIMQSTSRLIKTQIKESLDNTAKYAGKINESISGIENIKTQSLENKEREKISFYNEKMINTNKKQSNTFNGFNGSINFLSCFLNVLTYLVGGVFCVRGELTIGAFMAVSAYIGKVYTPIFTYSSMLIVLQPAFIALKRVGEFFFSETNNGVIDGKLNIDEIESVDFNKVSFGYEENNLIINEFSLKVCNGDKILLKGENGCGKSTLFRILLRLYPIENEKIFINGKDINCIRRDSLLKHIKYIAQKSFLFNDSIENNILYGLDSYDKEKYSELVDAFDLKPLIKRVEVENDGLIGTNGMNLSGGEIQKIILCRTLIQEPKFLILDEAVSNLDFKSKNFVKEYVRKSKATILIVDHTDDFSDVCNCKVNMKKVGV